MRIKQTIIVISFISLFLLSNYMVFQYTLKLSNKRIGESRGSLNMTMLLSLDQNITKPVKYVLASSIYDDIVTASLKRLDDYDDIEYFSFMCEQWDNNLTDIVMKNLRLYKDASAKPRQYELYLEGVKNLNKLCRDEK
jgi:hypothetical protein